MSRKIIFFIILFLLPFFLFSLTNQQIDRYLRNYSEPGYRFVKSQGENAWVLAFKSQHLKRERSVVVLLVSSNKVETLIVGTTVATFDREPSQALMRYLLQENGKDSFIGSFSLYITDKYYVQFFVRVPNPYASLDQIIYSAWYVALICDSYEDEILKFMR